MSAWCTPAEVRLQSGCAGSDISDADLGPFINASSAVLFARSGRQYGTRTITLRPCGQSAGDAGPPSWGRVGRNQGWFCCDRSPRRCSCTDGPEQLDLGVGAIQTVLEILVDGVALVEGVDFRVDEARWLVRLPDGDQRRSWPTSQRIDLPDTEEGTSSFTVTVGTGPPEVGRMAAAELACELSRLGTDDCRLSPRVTNVDRKGITFELTGIVEALQVGVIGLPLCDLFLSTYNPAKLQRRGRVVFPPPSQPRRVDGPGGS